MDREIRMDITQALHDTENALRDFIGSVLLRSFGSIWINKCGVSTERIKKWQERKKTEIERQQAGAVEERLIYYADFYDLKAILKKNWSGEFSAALGDWKTMEVWLLALEILRDPEAHRRELLPHQKHLILGISGEIRNKLIRYRSKKETSEDCFPRIESARDSLGNIWTPGEHDDFKIVDTNFVLRPGDTIDFVITARDPEGTDLEYGTGSAIASNIKWQNESSFTFQIQEENIGRLFAIHFYIRSIRQYHAMGEYDDEVAFQYTVLPRSNIRK